MRRIAAKGVGSSEIASVIWRMTMCCGLICTVSLAQNRDLLAASTKTLTKLISPKINTARPIPTAPKLAANTTNNAGTNTTVNVGTNATAFPLANTFLLHSRPAATKRIYLDFTGHSTKDTEWNSSTVTEIVTAPFSIDATPAFSSTELSMIQEIFLRVSECYSPFDVDVTTEEPPVADLINSGTGDTRWGIRVLIGVSTPSPAPDAGGVAFLTSFSWNTDTPCFVFPQSLGNATKLIADCSVHEAGHTLGLHHDGRTSPVEEYYFGHGSGATSWAPHMGAGYYVNLVQWSKGEYLNANDQEDDLAIISTQNGFGYRSDDFANTRASAGAVAATAGSGATANTYTVLQSGVIETRTDNDWFLINSGNGNIVITAKGGPVNTMLDISLELYSNSGTLVASSNPIDDVTATINYAAPAGTYFLKIDGVGKGSPLSTGYTDYSSLGQYTISGTYPGTMSGIASKVKAVYSNKVLTLTGDSNPNSLTVTFSAGTLKVEGANGTKINDLASYSVPHTGKLELNADLLDGDDGLSVVGVDSSTMTIKLGSGADKLAFTLCTIGTLNADGGDGTDVMVTTSSKITTQTIKLIP
ncbi:hypothetical protein [Schlesneria paludicola]|uniref:hypothetical protein n=1 Tax=Schlesneria paludicola TaxID=360056 RepID=UPI000680CD28|nr:hypothetical protein [Schlesneria paludicola]